MQQDRGQDNANRQPISDDYLSCDKFDPGCVEREHEMSLSQLLEPTPLDPQRIVQVDKLSLFIPRKDNDLVALAPLLSIPQQDWLAFRPFQTSGDQRVEMPPQSSAQMRPIEKSHIPPVKSISNPSQDSMIEKRSGPNVRRSTQFEQWNTRYQQLVAFQKEFNHCCVPLNYLKNPSLAHWVKRQRYQYRMKMKEGKHSTLTDERQKTLEKLGFVWDSHAAAWEERWNQLNEFRQLYGHSRVPKNYPANPSLVCRIQSLYYSVCAITLISHFFFFLYHQAVWVKCQRRQFKLYRQGMGSNMTPERIEKLQILDFAFDPRSGSKKQR